MDADRLLEPLAALEMRVLLAADRGDSPALQALLHPDFQEIGRSGQRYDLAQILALIGGLKPPAVPGVGAEGFALSALGEGWAQLVYRCWQTDPDQGTACRHAWRSSLWLQGPAGWLLRFHQATPCPPFEPGQESP